MPTRHLDLGCGPVPRNPYGADELYGLDIRVPEGVDAGRFRQANLVLEPIPAADGHFDSLSAYDFIEHMPRLVVLPNGTTRLPFVELMNEIWRVLKKPGGRLYAVTPAWPRAEAFVDPTHVNVITERTDEYFCGDKPLGRMYGFHGQFVVRRAEWVEQQRAFKANPASQAEFDSPAYKRAAHSVRDAVRWLRGQRKHRPPARQLIYFLWELEAVKPSSAVR